ncbi:adenosine deaminase [Actinopolymorpha sp. B11F2]|uniref:adenosine deaminase n=1 Tax=Actinopolymorpha sp. B11F2 TaxID=3160862 RepID=UPI0032E52880
MSDVMSAVASLPKVELHLHLVGSASVETVLELARRHPDAGVPTERAALAAYYEFHDFPHFLAVYGVVSGLVRTSADIVALVVGLARDAARSNVRYAEVTVTPTSHLRAGIAPDELAEALTQGRQLAAAEHRVGLNWIFDIAGGEGQQSGWETVAFALRHRPAGLVALGLGGLEVGVGRAQFRRHFTLAREAGLASVVHAGETTGPASVWSAIHDLGAARIGHGIGAVSDPRLLDHLRERRITVEMCPTSNVRTRAVASWEVHPLPRFLDHGVPVTLSTDDPGMFGAQLNDEYVRAATVFGLTQAELVQIARTGVRAALCEEPVRERLLAEIDAVADGPQVSTSESLRRDAPAS